MTKKEGKEMAKAQKNTVEAVEVVGAETTDSNGTNGTSVPVVQVSLDDKGRKKEVNMSMEEVEQKGWKNKSQIIRGLASDNFAPSAIAKFLNIRYQHVRNVLNQPLKRQA